METLRLWPAVSNGTFRELEHDEYITGLYGKKVILPKGTHCQINNWTRHRNTYLWGKDANIFNPYRNFRGDEIWNNEVFKSYNPSSKRFSPFSYSPRDCLGKNFAQMEMRLILIFLLHSYSFSLTIEQEKFSKQIKYIALNRATLGPRNLYENINRKAEKGSLPEKDKFLPFLDLACWVNVESRNNNNCKTYSKL